tara:strand:+ start:87 stop:347 length:261 start_codon:yes stop_codon:yes gene_type:complete
MIISNVQFLSIDDNGSDGLVSWYGMEVEGDQDMFGIHSDGALLDIDGVPVTPGDEEYRAVMYAIDQLAQKLQAEDSDTLYSQEASA